MTVGMRRASPYLRQSVSCTLGTQGLGIPRNFSLTPKLIYILLRCLFFFASSLFSWSKLMTVGIRHASPCLHQLASGALGILG